MTGYAKTIEAGAANETRPVPPGRSPEVAAPDRPNLSGDLDEVLQRPTFRVALRGYDQIQVENYVAWSELEIRSTQRASEQLADRYRTCAVELDRARQQLANTSAGAELWELSERMRKILALASEEATDLRAAGRADADQIRVQAEGNATSLLNRAQAEARQLMADANADAERIRAEAADLQAEAAAALALALTDGEAMVAAAGIEQDRINAEAAHERDVADTAAAHRLAQLDEVSRHERESAEAAAAARLEIARQQLEDLTRQRDQVSDALQHLNDHVSAALAGLPGFKREDAETETVTV